MPSNSGHNCGCARKTRHFSAPPQMTSQRSPPRETSFARGPRGVADYAARSNLRFKSEVPFAVKRKGAMIIGGLPLGGVSTGPRLPSNCLPAYIIQRLYVRFDKSARITLIRAGCKLRVREETYSIVLMARGVDHITMLIIADRMIDGIVFARVTFSSESVG